MKKVVQAGYAMPQWLTSTDGSRYVLFKPSKPLKNEDFITATNADYQGTAREIAISDVIDAVQAVNNESGMSVLGLPTALDAGAIWCSGAYVGESIARKSRRPVLTARTFIRTQTILPMTSKSRRTRRSEDMAPKSLLGTLG